MSDEVVLNVYELPMRDADDSFGCGSGSITSFLSKILPSVGFGAYHTSLDVNGYCYSYAVGGISKIPITDKHRHAPTGATFKESIVLGTVYQFANVESGTRSSSSSSSKPGSVADVVRSCVNNLQKKFFTPTGYHLAYRNCNHFTETLSTALILPIEDLLKTNPPPVLKRYPAWINRLARTGSTVLDKSADKQQQLQQQQTSLPNNNNNDKDSALASLYCEVIKEARFAAGILEYDDDQKMAAHLSSLSERNKQRKQKKELTDKQKSILAKLKKKSSN